MALLELGIDVGQLIESTAGLRYMLRAVVRVEVVSLCVESPCFAWAESPCTVHKNQCAYGSDVHTFRTFSWCVSVFVRGDGKVCMGQEMSRCIQDM